MVSKRKPKVTDLMNWKMDQNVVSQTFGSYASTTAFSCNTSSTTGILTSGWAQTSTIQLSCSTAAANLNAGDVIQIAGVYAVNPQNRQAYGSNKLRNFVVTSAATVATTGTTNVTVSPALISAGQFQNVSIPTPGASTVTPFNNTGAVSPQNMLFHRNAFTLAVADLELPEGVHFAGRASDKEIGLSMRVVRQYTINNDSIPTRLDVLYGWAPLYPELACRVAA
jgi:P22 coat protein - gene protein 5